MEIAGRVALVTGAAAGIGRAVAVRLAAERMEVVVADVDGAGGGETVRSIVEAGGRARFIRADVTREPDVSSMVAVAEEAFGGLDVVVNNAGGTGPPHYPDAPAEHWRACVELNLLAPMHVAQAALPALRRRGGGAIVNVASLAGIGGGPSAHPEYAAAKAGLIRLTETLRWLHERDGVRMICVAPNIVLTEALREQLAAMTDEERAALPAPLSTPDEIAMAVVEVLRDGALAGRVLLWLEDRPNVAPVNRWSAWRS
jgi:NAD(P)-dependent dehydrogenase (short-subunit alcohol dehydrogenase family)